MGPVVARAGRKVVTSRVLHVASLAGLAMLAVAAPAAAGPSSDRLAAALVLPSSDWKAMPGVVDVRYDGAAQLGADVLAGRASIRLPWDLTVRGVPVDGLSIGEGSISFHRKSQHQISIDGRTSSETDTGLAGPRIDVLAGPGVHVPKGGTVLALTTPAGLAVRWAPLQTPSGNAIAEILVDRSGNMTAQYLHVPAGLEASVEHGLVRLASANLRPSSGTAFTERAVWLPIEPVPGQRMARPKASDPPPPGCGQEAGTWCDRADGPGVSEIYLNEDFNDGLSTTRGWSGTDLWHQIPFAICSPGATSNPGRSWYYGRDLTCLYLPNGQGGLTSPVVGPITFGTGLNFQFRLGFEPNFDQAEIYVNGVLFIIMPQVPDPTLWYHFVNPLDLSFFAGSNIQIEFRLTSDSSNEDLGWMVDDVQVWNPSSANVPCVINAGKNGNAACSDRVNREWTFYELNFCQSCVYTFYVLVECGREMHIPLDDMEGADIQITSMATGSPVPLHCINQTALADAGLGAYPDRIALDCCSPPGTNETWYGPAFDVIDNAGPGHVSWGFGTNGCGSILAYDTNGDNQVGCSELNPPCGGLLSQIGPGESQVVDCFIEDNNGLCGLYRVDITSGGNLWNLFANCDGTNIPKFQIFYDCSEAWTAYNPLPELAIANLTTANGCPALQVDFDLQNVGCLDQVGPTLVRLTSNCLPTPDRLDVPVAGPVPAGGSVHVSVPFAVSCAPVRVLVAADPDDSIVECTESLTIASCRADRGVDSLATFTCGCTAQLVADAGADRVGCALESIQLDGRDSTIAPCANPQYKWTDAAGGLLQDWSPVSTLNVQVGPCPGGAEYTLQVKCRGEGCSETDTVRVDCYVIAPNAGADVRACVGDPVVLNGSGTVITNCATNEYKWTDRFGTIVRDWDTDPTLDLGGLTCSNAGLYRLEARCLGNLTCSEVDDVQVDCVDVRANAGPDIRACDGVPFNITRARSTRTNCTSSVYQWFDAGGAPLTTPSASPDYTGTITGCPTTVTLTLEATCADAGFLGCGQPDTVDITCTRPTQVVPTATVLCGRRADLHCGVVEAGVIDTWDTDTAIDSDGDTNPANDRSAAGCDITAYQWPTAGIHVVRSIATDANQCAVFADISVEVFDDPIVPVPTAQPGCAGSPSQLRCGVSPPEAGVTYTWDTDVAVDSDADTDPANDADQTGCDVAVTYAAGSYTVKVTARDARNCSSNASTLINVAGPTAPPEVVDDRVTKSAGALVITWPPVAGAATYRVTRGSIDTWFSHGADPAAGRGSCDTGGTTTFTDGDDLADPSDWYYIVTAVDPCGIEGTQGSGTDGHVATPRDPPNPACP